MKKSFEKEIVQVLNNMVKAGIVLAKKLINGETYYSLANNAQVKTKPAMPAVAKKNLSDAARKAWVTRRKNTAIKAVRKAAACKAVKTKQKNKTASSRYTEAARKAWATRRSRNVVVK